MGGADLVFHSPRGLADMKKAVAETEAERMPLAEAIAAAMVPVPHTIQIARAVE